MSVAVEEAAGRVIAGWRSAVLSERAQRFAREAVAAAAPATPARAKALLFAASKLAGFAEQVGLELEAGVLLHPSVIERFILCGCEAVSPASRRTLRTNLRALGRALEAHPQPRPVPLPRERAKQPYSEAEIASYLRLAEAQRAVPGRMRALALICLGAGAGIVAGELRHLRGSDVVFRSGGLLVLVGGARARTVPVLERFHEPLAKAASFAGDRYLIGGTDSRPAQPHRRAVPGAVWRQLAAKARARAAALELVLTDRLDGDDGAIEDGDVGDERPNNQRVSEAGPRTGTAAARGSRLRGASGCASRVETASLPAVDPLAMSVIECSRDVAESRARNGERMRPTRASRQRRGSESRRVAGAAVQQAGERDSELPWRDAEPQPQPGRAGRPAERVHRVHDRGFGRDRVVG